MDTLNTDSDERLIAKTLEGELTAFEQLVERHRAVVYRVAARIVGREDAADVSQDAFLRAFHRLERFRGTAPFRSWLLQITHNAAVDSLARKRRHPLETPPEEDASPDRDPRRQPASELERREREQRLELKLGLLRSRLPQPARAP